MSEDKVVELDDTGMEYDDGGAAKTAVSPKNFDVSRSLRLSGLPTSLNDEEESALREIVCESISSALNLANNDWLESVGKLPLNADLPEDSQMQAVVVFKSRIHKHRVFTQRAKMEKPIEIFQITHSDVESWGLKDADDDKPTDATHTNGKDEKEEKEDENKEPGIEEPPRFVINWDGAPEFQWRIPDTEMDAYKLVIENICIGDLDSAWLYQSMMRARNIEFSASSSTFKGNFDHNPLRRGTLTLTYNNDNIAMAQAVNGFVCIRTRPNKRIKIFLPQTPNTLRMRGQLERKLGRVHKPNLKSRQLLVRNVGENIEEKDVKQAFSKVTVDEIEGVEFREDAMKRRCGIVTFKTPEMAIWAHLKHDEVKTGRSNKWSRVFYMQDIQEAELLLKPELRDVGNPMAMKRARSRSRSPPGAGKRTNIGGAGPGGRYGGPPPNRGGFGGRGGAFGGRGPPMGERGPPPMGGGRGPPMGGRGPPMGGPPMGAPNRDMRDGPMAPRRDMPPRGGMMPNDNDWNRGPPASALPPVGGLMGAGVGAGAPAQPRADPVFQMQQQLKQQEDQLQMQNRIMEQSDLIKELAVELKKVRGSMGGASGGGGERPAAAAATGGAATFGRAFGGYDDRR